MQSTNNQNLLDITCQETGTLDSLFLIAQANERSATDLPAPGSELSIIGGADKKKLEYLKERNVQIGTAGRNGGIGSYIIGHTFTIGE